MVSLGIFFFFLGRLLDVMLFAVMARVILSWAIGHDFQHSKIYQFLLDVTNPLFDFVRLLPHRFGMLDISAIYVFILLDALSYFLSLLQASLVY